MTTAAAGDGGTPPGDGMQPPAGDQKPPAGGYGTSTRAPLNGGAPPPEQQQPPAGGAQRREPVIPEIPLRDRLARAGKVATEAVARKWKEAVGSDDPAAVKARLDRLDALEKAEKEREAATLTEVDRAKAERDEAVRQAEDLKQRLADLAEERLYDKQDAIIRGIAAQHVADDAVDFARFQWRKHVLELDAADQAKLTERDAKKFFERLAKDKPRHAREQPAAADPAKPPPPPATRPSPRGAPARPQRPPPPPAGAVRRPATNGAPPPRRPETQSQADTDPTMHNGKTTRPGRPNSMNPKELKEFAALKGVNYSG